MNKKQALLGLRVLRNMAAWGVAFGYLTSAPALAGLSGRDVMAKNEENRQLNQLIARARVSTFDGTKEKSKEFNWWRKLKPDNVHYNTLTKFTAPAEVRHQGILIQENAGGQNDVQMYLPTFKKIRRVESGQQSGSFMGTEFSYSDISSPHVDDYKYKVLKENETCPGVTPATACYLIEFEPASDEVKDRTGVSRAQTYLRHDNFMITQAEYFDLKNEHWKTLEASDTRIVDEARKKWMSMKVKMTNSKNKKYTLLQFSDVKVTQAIPESTFSNQALSREGE
jgi:outer membrane lipoprotein-sorting protein